MSAYIGNIPVPQATQTRQTFIATASQTTFNTAGYTAGFVDVYMNGVKLVDGTDFTATNGSTVVLTTGAAADDIIEVVAYSTYEVNSQNYTGGLTVDNDGATVLTVDRATSDGTIIDVQKNGSSVGSIGVAATDDVYFAGGTGSTKGIYLNDNGVLPATTGGSASDATVDLGNTVLRWKDLYLSGGVYLGGTGSANLLDDYEEGTWTPNFSVNGFTQAVSSTSGTYTKVGRQVTVTWKATLDSSGYASGYSLINNLPFTVFSTQSASAGFYGTGDIGSNTIGSSGYPEASTSNLYLYPSISTNNTTAWEGTHTYFVT